MSMSSSASLSSRESELSERQANPSFGRVTRTPGSVDGADPRSRRADGVGHARRPGDCDELARLLLAAQPLIKSRLRSIRAGADPSDRAWSTSDAFSSVMRRIMVAGQAGSIRCMDGAPSSAPGSPRGRAMWSFIDAIVRSVAGDAGRRRQRRRRQARAALEAFRTQRPVAPSTPPGDARVEDLSRMLRSLDPLDRSIALLRLRGACWASVAVAHSMSVDACRQRWCRTIVRLRALSAPEFGAEPTRINHGSEDFSVTSPDDRPASSGGIADCPTQGVA